MNDQEQKPEEQVAQPEAVANTEVPTPPVKKVIVANGDEVIVEPYHLAILVMMDARNGSLGIYDLQNCATRATAKMLLNESLDHYKSAASAASTVQMLAEISKNQPKKGAIFNPFGKKD